MRRIEDTTQFYREFDKYQKNKNQPLNKKSYSQFAQKGKDKQLYELCQHLSHQNRQLKKENNELKKMLQCQSKDRLDSYTNQYQTKQYRQANYESYKKKSIQLISSVKFLHKLYTQRTSLKKIDDVLQKFMAKLKSGRSNVIIQLVRFFDQTIKQTENIEWNIDQIERQTSKYQNQLLRKHIAKMNNIIIQCLYQLKRDVGQINQDIRVNQQNVNKQIHYYCQKYLDFNQKQPKNAKECIIQEYRIKPVSQISKGKTKKSNNKAKILDQNFNSLKFSGQKNSKPKSKPLQSRNIVPNIIQRLSQSLAQVKSLTNHSLPLCRQKQSKPPKPFSVPKRQEKTIADQLRTSNNTGKSSVTPKSRGSATKSHLKDSSVDYNFRFQGTPGWNSHNNSSRKYYR